MYGISTHIHAQKLAGKTCPVHSTATSYSVSLFFFVFCGRGLCGKGTTKIAVLSRREALYMYRRIERSEWVISHPIYVYIHMPIHIRVQVCAHILYTHSCASPRVSPVSFLSRSQLMRQYSFTDFSTCMRPAYSRTILSSFFCSSLALFLFVLSLSLTLASPRRRHRTPVYIYYIHFISLLRRLVYLAQSRRLDFSLSFSLSRWRLKFFTSRFFLSLCMCTYMLHAEICVIARRGERSSISMMVIRRKCEWVMRYTRERSAGLYSE